MAAVTMYRIEHCPHCIAAEALLREVGIPFEQVYLDDHPDRRAFTASIKPGHTTVPLVVAGDRPVGGRSDLEALHRRGELKRVLLGT